MGEEEIGHSSKAKELESIKEMIKQRFEKEHIHTRLDKLTKEIETPNLWDNSKKAASLLREQSQLKKLVQSLNKLDNDLNDYRMLLDMGENEQDKSEYYQEASRIITEALSFARDLEIKTIMSKELDSFSCYLEVNAGSGGTESCDWCEMLFRMYSKWALNRGYSIETIDESSGEIAGIKSGTVKIEGEYAFGWMRTEIGVHRLVRISPFDANAKRHTSFASVFVYPHIESSIDFEIDKKDLRIDTLRSSGAGGQHVNKTDSAVRITHIPTGTVVKVQADRSQHRNRDTAMDILKGRLFALEQQKKEQEQQAARGAVGENTWGNQIRSYVLQPYKLVKDNRTGVESHDPFGVLEGSDELDSFLKAALVKGL